MADPAGEATPRPPLAGGLVGYRLLRRIASGERADVYLAAADRRSRAASKMLLRSRHPQAIRRSPAEVRHRPSWPCASIRPRCRVSPSPSRSRRCRRMPGARCPPSTTSRPSTTAGAAWPSSASPGSPCRASSPSARLRPGEAVTILAPIAVAVADLAARGFVHTRLAAADILLDDAGRPRLVGLGALRRLPGDERAGEHTALLRTAHVALTDLLEDVASAVRPAGVFDDAVDLMRGRLDDASVPAMRGRPGASAVRGGGARADRRRGRTGTNGATSCSHRRSGRDARCPPGRRPRTGAPVDDSPRRRDPRAPRTRAAAR